MSNDKSIHIGKMGDVKNSVINSGDVKGSLIAGNQQTTSEDLDMTQLAAELAQLRIALQPQITTAQEAIAFGKVAQAEEAAQAQDLPTALSHLGQAGQWALNAATGLGINVALAALKRALGMN
jgi:hypothetical protein